jgi:hypothetical protein
VAGALIGFAQLGELSLDSTDVSGMAELSQGINILVVILAGNSDCYRDFVIITVVCWFTFCSVL